MISQRSLHIKELSSSTYRQTTKIRQSDVVYEICCNLDFFCQDAYIGETSQPLQHLHKQHCRPSYNVNDSAALKHIIASELQINVNDVAILDREKNWFERCEKEAVWV